MSTASAASLIAGDRIHTPGTSRPAGDLVTSVEVDGNSVRVVTDNGWFRLSLDCQIETTRKVTAPRTARSQAFADRSRPGRQYR